MRSNLSTLQAAGSGLHATVSDYLELTKPSIVWLILMSTVVGFYAASAGSLDYILLLHTVVGTALLAGGTGALNQWLEREADGKMRRTENRPLPAGRLRAGPAFWFGAGISVAGSLYLLLAVNTLAFAIGLVTLTSYVFLYTPLKARTPLATLVGAFPGAAPPLIGWAAVRNDLGLEAWVLFTILFLWQFPHFYAIGWMYREDYARAGILMLPVVDPDGVSTGRQTVCYAALLLPVSLAPTLLGMTGQVYFAGALLLGAAYLYHGVLLARRKTGPQARRLLQASVLYLPLLYCLLALDKA